ncbi:MAG: F0F1 ATP synthase subunit gamma [Gammaproteobacteria bacterium]|nr:MAG: F0F1 ATP synthase subunit gamma [Gammaproteobacteria bacterium]
MASEKEIRTKIKSIQSTQKITKAMEMVAASKMRKAQDRMLAARPYADKMRNLIAHLAHAHSEYKHAFLSESDVNSVGFIVISTDKGLCGGLNINLFKSSVNAMQEWNEQDVDIKLCTIGSKGIGFFKRLGATITSEISHLGDFPSIEDIIGTVKVMLDAFNNGEINKLYMVYNEFVNSMTQSPKVEQLLPIKPEVLDQELHHHWDYIYEPDSKAVLDQVFIRYIESLVYHGLVENIACEQSARMVAMKSASDNAGELISELQLAYNKARQASITQEISEIVGGAAAVS